MNAHKLIMKACSLVLIGSILLSSTASTLAHGEDESMHDFSGITYSKQALEDENVMVIPFSEINQIAEEARGWIDDGTMLYISAPEASNEELAEMLSIPKDDVHVYSSMVILATAIYRYEDIYVFENHYAIFETKEKRGNSVDQDVPMNNTDFSATVTTVDQQNQLGELGFLVDADLAIGTAIESRRKTSEFSDQVVSQTEHGKSTSLPKASRTYTGTINVLGSTGKYLGYIKSIQNNYNKGNATVNNKKQYVYDIVTKFEAYPSSSSSVSKYTGRIHCNISGHTSLESASLPSNVSTAKGIQLGVTSSGASGGVTTGWTYNPESQSITKSSPKNNVYDWTAKPVNPKKGKSYDLTPGLRVATTNGSGSRGGFSKMTCDALLFGISVKSNSFEIGGWF